MNRGKNVYIIGGFTEEMDKAAIDREVERYREAENQLACFGFGVLSIHHLPADLRGRKGCMIRAAMIEAADMCYAISYDPDIMRTCDVALADALGKPVFLPDALYKPYGCLRKMMGVEEIKN